MSKKDKQERAIIILVGEEERRVSYESFLKSTLRMLIEFGYPSLTLEEVREQVEKILVKESDLTVIGVIIKAYISEDQSEA